MKYVLDFLDTIKKQSKILYVIALIHLVVSLVCIVGFFIDYRTLMGISVWIKPLKFNISVAVYLLTVGFLITLYPYSNLKKNIINHITAWTLLVEVGIITYQGVRGVQSHYNTSSAFDGILFGIMGLLVAINVLVMIWFIFDTIRLKLHTEKSIQWAILLGWIVIVIGSWIGGQMIKQMSHTVGVADGGEGLPLLNWSTIAGDLRVTHFFSLHAIQIIPLFAFVLSKKWKSTSKKQILVVTAFALVYAFWIGFVFYQAKQGIPLIRL